MARTGGTMRAGRTAIPALAAVALACGGGPEEVPLLPFTEEEDHTLAAGRYCVAAEWAVRTPDAWQTLWSQVVAGTGSTPPAPAVDFETETVLFAALGMRPTSGYAVEFTRAVDQAGAVRVGLLVTSPAPACTTLPVVTCPAAAVRIARRGAAFVLVPFLQTACGP